MNEQPPPGPSAAPPAPAPSRIGLVLCRCGPNLFNLIELGPLEAAAHWPEAAAVATRSILCSAEGQAWLAGWLASERLDRLVIAACSPREHELTFRAVMARAGRNPYLLQLVNLREQVEWIGGAAEAATARAERLVRAGLARVARHQPRERREIDVSPDVVVVGGGAAGVAAALALARKDRKVLLVERSPALGGLAAQLDEIFPDHVCASCFLEPALDEVLHHERIEVLTQATVRRVRGSAGAFQADGGAGAPLRRRAEVHRLRPVQPALPGGAGRPVGRRARVQARHRRRLRRRAAERAHPRRGRLPAPPRRELRRLPGGVRLRGHPARRQARGADASRRCHRGGDRVPARRGGRPAGRPLDVAAGAAPPPQRSRRGKLERAGRPAPRSVLLASTADDRDGALAPHELLKLARGLRRRWPALAVAVAGGLSRTPGLQAEARAAAEAGVELLDEELLPDGLAAAGPAVTARLAHGPLETERNFDLVVIHSASRPSEGAEGLAALLRLDRDERGFLSEGSANPFEPTATRVAGSGRTLARGEQGRAGARCLSRYGTCPPQSRPRITGVSCVGFSQGTMMALHVALRRPQPLAAVVGYSGIYVTPESADGPDKAKAEIRSRPPVLLVHGAQDDLIPAQALFVSANLLAAAEVPVQWHLSPNVGHGIDGEGLRQGGEFLAKAFSKAK